MEWTKEAIEAARDRIPNKHLIGLIELRAALDAACEVQGLETIGYRASQKSFESGRKIGRAEALEEAAALLERKARGSGAHVAPALEHSAIAIRDLKDKHAQTDGGE